MTDITQGQDVSLKSSLQVLAKLWARLSGDSISADASVDYGVVVNGRVGIESPGEVIWPPLIATVS